MKKILLMTVFVVSFSGAMAQGGEYKTFIYTSKSLSDDISAGYEEFRQGERGLGEDLSNAALGAAKGIVSGYVGSVFDFGVQAVANLINRKKRMKEEWLEEVNSENIYETHISSVADMNDFYRTTSTDGALDPKGMTFDGIGSLRMDGNDTVFYISCHIDRSKIDRIIRHSKFQLILDTLIISPFHSNLPNSYFDTAFSFKDRTNFILTMEMELTSSWMDQLPQMHRDQVLGQFYVIVPVSEGSLDSNGFLRYARKADESPQWNVVGESFIVPRSYTGMRDQKSGKLIYGTGEYNLSITLRESCSLTASYKANWKANRKQRKKALKDRESLVNRAWQTVTSQQWDEISQQWIITVLQAPADVLKNESIEKLKLNN